MCTKGKPLSPTWNDSDVMDISTDLQAIISTAASNGTPLYPRGSGSKNFLGKPVNNSHLDVGEHSGILTYEPTELVITARAGTSLQDIETTLAEQGQMLAFEPPHFGPDASLGGTLACGLSGPRRPHTGAARDFVLGTRIINGKGEILRFGGEVMKNVAGYDVSRLITGSMGTLGLILDASLKVLPRPASDITLVQTHTSGTGLNRIQNLAREPLPISATLVHDDKVYLRLSGASENLARAHTRLGGEILADADIWLQVREHRHEFFSTPAPLWRLAVPAYTEALPLQGQWLIEWGGSQRWLKSEADAATIHAAASDCGGHAMLYRGKGLDSAARRPLSKTLLALHLRTKAALDPGGIFNPHRYFEEF